MGEEGESSIIFDCGSGYSEIGFAGSDLPANVFPSIVGTPRQSDFQVVSKPEKDGAVRDASDLFFAGEDVLKHYNSLFVSRPIDRGVITHWEDGERLLDHCFNMLQVDPTEQPLLLSEPSLATTNNREKLVEMVFETFSTPEFYLCNQSTASLYSVGRTTGIVLDVGEGTTTAVPISEGFCCYHALHKAEFGGYDVTNYLKQLCFPDTSTRKLKAWKPNNPTHYSFETMKESLGYVALNPEEESASAEVFKLPDNSEVELVEERFKIFEPYFNPSGGKYPVQFLHFGMMKPLPEAVCESIATSEEEYEIRQKFFENVLITGGGSKVKGFKERFKKDIVNYAPKEFEVNIIGEGDEEQAVVDPSNNVWVGESIMACLTTTKEKFLKRSDYEEHGAEVVFHKLSLFE